MRPWVLGAWVLLTLGITAGSYWAYYELGWGGWWFWDPVENASLMPWLAATALLHSVNVLAARGALRAWTMMLAMIAFSMSMVGTFLVRSGILTSVHSFAVDPGRGTFLLALLGIYTGAAFALFALRTARLKEGAPFELVSRESGLVVNNLLLTVILGIVFFGTLYPLFVEALSGEKLSVGPPYFNAVAGPLALILAILVGVGPLLAWRQERRPVFRKLTVPALIAATALVISLFAAPQIGMLPRLGLTVAAWLAVASWLPLVRSKPLAHAAVDLGHGRGAFRGRSRARRHGQRQRVQPREACCHPCRGNPQCRSMAGQAAGPYARGRSELDGDRGRATRDSRRRRNDSETADPLLHQPADRDQ